MRRNRRFGAGIFSPVAVLLDCVITQPPPSQNSSLLAGHRQLLFWREAFTGLRIVKQRLAEKESKTPEPTQATAPRDTAGACMPSRFSTSSGAVLVRG